MMIGGNSGFFSLLLAWYKGQAFHGVGLAQCIITLMLAGVSDSHFGLGRAHDAPCMGELVGQSSLVLDY